MLLLICSENRQALLVWQVCARKVVLCARVSFVLPAIILSRPFDLPSWLTPIIHMLLPFVDGSLLMSKIAVAAFDSFWRSHRAS